MTPTDSQSREEMVENPESEEDQRQEENQPVFTAEGHYRLREASGVMEESDCEITLGTQLVGIDPSGAGAHHDFAYREMTEIKVQGYQIEVSLGDYALDFGMLGDKFDGFLSNLYSLRNDQAAKDYLIQEGKPNFFVIGQIETGGAASDGEVRVYKTRLGLFTNPGRVMIVRFSEIANARFENWTATFQLESGETIIVRQLGENFEALSREFQKANSELSKETSELLREVCPDIPFGSLMKLSRLMRDGKAVQIKQVETLSPEFMKAFETQMGLGESVMYESLDYLLHTLGDPDSAFIGAKKLVSNYLYLLIQIKGKEIVAFDSNETGHATYFFKGSDIEEIVLGLRDLNFRREPIYLPDIELQKPTYVKYTFAAAKLPAIKALRARFLGRAIHSDFDTWKSQVQKIVDSSG